MSYPYPYELLDKEGNLVELCGFRSWHIADERQYRGSIISELNWRAEASVQQQMGLDYQDMKPILPIPQEVTQVRFNMGNVSSKLEGYVYMQLKRKPPTQE